jgi:hypothetical protein
MEDGAGDWEHGEDDEEVLAGGPALSKTIELDRSIAPMVLKANRCVQRRERALCQGHESGQRVLKEMRN